METVNLVRDVKIAFVMKKDEQQTCCVNLTRTVPLAKFVKRINASSDHQTIVHPRKVNSNSCYDSCNESNISLIIRL